MRAFVVAIAFVAAGFALAQPAAEPGASVELESTVFDIGRKLRCPTCVSESVADSNSRVATEMRTEIRELLQQGRSEREILATYRERYGAWILLEPPREGIHLLVWALPALALGAGLLALAVLMLRWTRAARAAASDDPPDAEARQRVRDALEADR